MMCLSLGPCPFPLNRRSGRRRSAGRSPLAHPSVGASRARPGSRHWVASTCPADRYLRDIVVERHRGGIAGLLRPKRARFGHGAARASGPRSACAAAGAPQRRMKEGLAGAIGRKDRARNEFQVEVVVMIVAAGWCFSIGSSVAVSRTTPTMFVSMMASAWSISTGCMSQSSDRLTPALFTESSRSGKSASSSSRVAAVAAG